MDLTRALGYSATLHYADIGYRPIDVFVTYDGKRASDIPVSRYAVRHLVAAEVDCFPLSRPKRLITRVSRLMHLFSPGMLRLRTWAHPGNDLEPM